MKSIIFIATLLIGVASANNCTHHLVEKLIWDEILQCFQSNYGLCDMLYVYQCGIDYTVPDGFNGWNNYLDSVSDILATASLKLPYQQRSVARGLHSENPVQQRERWRCIGERCPVSRSAIQCVLDKVGRERAYFIAVEGIVPGYTQSEFWYASQWANSTGSETGDWRPDNRCGAKYPLPDGRPGQCNPNGKWPCCSPGGWCGDSYWHCECDGCNDFRLQAWNPETAVCGPQHNLADGRPGECDPTGKWPCCSPGGWCGNSPLHCECNGCIDFTPQGVKDAVKIRNAVIEFAIDCIKEMGK